MCILFNVFPCYTCIRVSSNSNQHFDIKCKHTVQYKALILLKEYIFLVLFLFHIFYISHNFCFTTNINSEYKINKSIINKHFLKFFVKNHNVPFCHCLFLKSENFKKENDQYEVTEGSYSIS